MGIFNQPFPHDTSWQHRLMVAASFGIFIALFLAVFRPFELDQVERSLLVKSCVTFGLVTFICIFATNTLLEFFFPGVFDEKGWTTGKQILNVGLIIVLIGLINFLFAIRLFPGVKLALGTALKYQAIALSIGLLPVIVYTLYLKNRWLHRFRQEAAELQQKLVEKKKLDASQASRLHEDETTLLFESANERDNVQVSLHDLVYLEAASNYVKIYFMQEGKLGYSISRMTMKKAAGVTAPYSLLFRCHRAYIVNLDRVERIEGNAQGYKLKLQHVDGLIPVSRNLNHEFSDILLAFRKKAAVVK